MAAILLALSPVAFAQTQSTAANGQASAGATVFNEAGSGSGSGRVDNNPDALAPQILSQDVCAQINSGGLSAGGVALAFGHNGEFSDCTRRADAHDLTAMGVAENRPDLLQWGVNLFCEGPERSSAPPGTCAPVKAGTAQVVYIPAAPAKTVYIQAAPDPEFDPLNLCENWDHADGPKPKDCP